MAGVLCLFPFFLMCCDCYQKQTERIYSLELADYETIANALRQFPYLQSVKIFVQDNLLTPQKSNMIESGLPPSVHTFVFNNSCMAFDVNNDE